MPRGLRRVALIYDARRAYDLERRFGAVLGSTIRTVIRRTQLERARHLVSDTDVPLRQVAADVGFKSVQHLTTTFVRVFGQTPARYRHAASR